MVFKQQFPRILFAILITLFILSLANIYLIKNGHIATSSTYNPKSENSTNIESIYFATTTMSTVGYGDILPKTEFGKICIALEQLFLICIALGGISYEMST